MCAQRNQNHPHSTATLCTSVHSFSSPFVPHFFPLPPLQVRSSSLGSCYGMWRVGTLYRGGLGVEVDLKAAIMWFNRAVGGSSARGGGGGSGVCVEAVYDLACVLGEGRGEGRGAGSIRSQGLFREAADMGHVGAMVVVGVEEGEQGVGRLEVACGLGSGSAANYLGLRCWRGAKGNPSALGSTTTGSTTGQDDTAAFNYFLMSARRGCFSGMCNAGWCLENGVGTVRDVKGALEWYEKGSRGERNEDGSIRAMCYLGRLKLNAATVDLAFGTSLSTHAPAKSSSDHYREAMQWLRRACEGGSSLASYTLGSVYHTGILDARGGVIVPRDDNAALEYCLRCCDGGEEGEGIDVVRLGAKMCGEMFYEGAGTRDGRSDHNKVRTRHCPRRTRHRPRTHRWPRT